MTTTRDASSVAGGRLPEWWPSSNPYIIADCLEIMRQLPDGCIDLTVTSPPYDNLRDYEGFTFDFENVAEELYRITKDGGIVVWVVGDATIKGSETGTSFRQALYFKHIGFNLHDTMIYEKNSFSMPDTVRYYNIFEYMFILSKGKPKTLNLLKDKKNRWGGSESFGKGGNRDKSKCKVITVNEYGMRNNIWRYNTGKGFSSKEAVASKHPAIFPDKLAEDHIISWSNEGDIIFDPMLGSGTTIKMAQQLNRTGIGCETSSEYEGIIKERIKQPMKLDQFVAHPQGRGGTGRSINDF